MILIEVFVRFIDKGNNDLPSGRALCDDTR